MKTTPFLKTVIMLITNNVHIHHSLTSALINSGIPQQKITKGMLLSAYLQMHLTATETYNNSVH
jgi:hypothetical protein